MAGRFTGNRGIAKIGATTYDITGWECSESTDFANATDTSDYDATDKKTYVSEMPNDVQLTGSFEMNIHSTQWPFPAGNASAPHNTVRAGAYCAISQYFRDPTGPAITCNAWIESVRISSQRKNMVTASVQWRSDGKYTIPTTGPA